MAVWLFTPSWFTWNSKIVYDFPIFLLVIPVLHQAPHSEVYELLLLPKQVFPASSVLFHFSTCWPFSKKTSCVGSSPSSFYFVWFRASWTVWFWTSSWISTWMIICLWQSFWIYYLHLFSSTKNIPSSWSWKPFHLLHQAIHYYCWFALLVDIACISHVLLQLTSGCHWIASTLLQQQLYSCLNKAGFQWHYCSSKSRIQSLPPIFNLRQFVLPSFWWWLLHSLSSAKITLAFLNFTALSQEVQFLLMYCTWKIWYLPLCIIWKISIITLMHSSWCCMWLICTNFIIDSCNHMFLLELLHLLEWHLSDQVYKLLQHNFYFIWLSRGLKYMSLFLLIWIYYPKPL